MAAFTKETVTRVHHWNDTLFSFRTTRSTSLRFENGQFVMLGLEVDGKPLLRAYSIASPNYAEHLEFFSIKVPNGPLTSRLQNIQVGDEVMVGSKPTGTLIADFLLPDAKNLYMISSGTGLAPFISIIQDPTIYEHYEKVIVTHGVRHVSDLAYKDFITQELPQHEYFGDLVKEKLIYYPTVTREAYEHQGRLTNLITSGKLFSDIGLPEATPENDRFMICGSAGLLADTSKILADKGFSEYRYGQQAHVVVERAFVDK